MNQDPFTERIIGCAIEVHRNLGPGLLESAYQKCLAHELQLQGIPFQREMKLPVHYKGVDIDCAYRIDFLVDNQVILELKAVKELLDVHTAQILTYMRLQNINKGLLINFNNARLVDGVRRLRL